MVMAKAKQPLIKALVVAIEKYPVIWDKNDPEHKINYQKQLAWGKVHAEMKSKFPRELLLAHSLHTGDKLRKQWKTLKDCKRNRWKRSMEINGHAEDFDDENQRPSFYIKELKFTDTKVEAEEQEQEDETSWSFEHSNFEDNDESNNEQEYSDMYEAANEDSKFVQVYPMPGNGGSSRMQTDDVIRERKENSLIKGEIAKATLRNLEEKHRLEIKLLQLEFDKRKRILDVEIEIAELKRDLAKRQLLDLEAQGHVQIIENPMDP